MNMLSYILIFLGSAVPGKISDIDTALALLDIEADHDAIVKLNVTRHILASELFGRRRKRSDESKIKYLNDLLQ